MRPGTSGWDDGGITEFVWETTELQSMDERVMMSATPTLGITSPSIRATRLVNTDEPVEGSRVQVEGRLGVIIGFPSVSEVRVLFDDGCEEVIEASMLGKTVNKNPGGTGGKAANLAKSSGSTPSSVGTKPSLSA